MAYIGREPTNTGEFLLIDDISGDFNGSTTSFTLKVGLSEVNPAAANTVIVLDGVLQHPSSSYSISGSTISFTEAPDASLSFYGIVTGQSQYIANNSINDDHISETANISGSKINNCWKRFKSEWTTKLLDDSSVSAISGSKSDFVDQVTSRSDYKNRLQRGSDN